MRIFLKLLPYLLIIALGVAIYGGFRYMSNELSKTKEEKQCLIIEKAELESRLESINKVSNISIDQLEEMRKNEKASLIYIGECNQKIDAMKLNEDINIVLVKINNYEVCMAKNSLKPEVKCELELQ